MSHQFDARFEVKAVGADGSFEGYASLFGAVDQGRDIVAPGAFSRSILERGAKGIKLLWQHDPTEPIGTIEDIFEDRRGLFVKGHLLPGVKKAEEALRLMRAGALDGLSIGFHTVKSRMDETGGIRILLYVDLWEVSLVTFPMQPEARISAFKASDFPTIRQLETFLREAGGLSRAGAKAVAAQGFSGLSTRRDAGDGWPAVVTAIRTLENKLKSSTGDTL